MVRLDIYKNILTLIPMKVVIFFAVFMAVFFVLAWFAQPPKWPTNEEMRRARKDKKR